MNFCLTLQGGHESSFAGEEVKVESRGRELGHPMDDSRPIAAVERWREVLPRKNRTASNIRAGSKNRLGSVCPLLKVCQLPDLQESYDSRKSVDQIALGTGSNTVPALIYRGGGVLYYVLCTSFWNPPVRSASNSWVVLRILGSDTEPSRKQARQSGTVHLILQANR